MKNLICLTAILTTLFFTACSNTDQDPISSNIAHIEKSNVFEISHPFALYQEFPELNPAIVSWKNARQGIVISIGNVPDIKIRRFLFATIEYINGKGTVMAFLGDSKSGSYYLNGFNEKHISGINVYYYDETSSVEVAVLPYKEAELFKNIQIKVWADGGEYVKVASFPFPAKIQYLFSELITSQGNQLMFLGNPKSEDFDFPKSEKLILKDIKLFTYVK